MSPSVSSTLGGTALSKAVFLEAWRAFQGGVSPFTMAARRTLQAERTAASFAKAWTYPREVFANSDLGLEYIDAYGFDHDYTLASYNRKLESMIYDLGVETLIRDRGYPRECLQQLRFDPNFAVRGLHYDTKYESFDRNGRY